MSKNDNSSKPEELLKWHLLRIWFKECKPQHHKYCICICPKRGLFYFINSDPPFGRKARELALHVSRFEVTPLTRDSFIDTTDLVAIPDDGRIEVALADEKCFYNFISPSLRQKILDAVYGHEAL